VNPTKIKLFSIIGGSAIVAAGALGLTVAQAGAAPSGIGGSGSEMTTGNTVTVAPATEASVPMAVPSIKGPAPLPLEEQGLPG
jgi:hypothetical protein